MQAFMATLLSNKKARFDYEILEKFKTGLELRGYEVKSLRDKRGSLAGSHAIIRGGEVFVVGMDIPPYQAKNLPDNFEEQRTIKLLLNKKEIRQMESKLTQRGLTLIPTMVYSTGRIIKMEIGLAKGKKEFEKREKIKERESKRKIGRIMKDRV